MAMKGSVTGEIVRYIQKNIKNGSWKVGEKIPSENQLCQELGVSRVSVRNALKQFIALGILESFHGKGTYVSSNDLSLFSNPEDKEIASLEVIDSMRLLLEFRCMIEPSVAYIAAQNPTPELISTLENLLKTMQDSVGQARTFVDADVAFHLELCRASKNPYTLSVMTDIFQKRADLGYMLNLAAGYYGGIYYHSLIINAIKARNPKQARAIMTEHLERGIYDLSVDNVDNSSDSAEFSDRFSPSESTQST